ncbi:uncharacterized protein LOC110099280 [Dendrobium catenatum]|uniref:uncharacterized protein LOC110099280 n=1 Tax=Dendrobium catenatum TaxID=906689 RepID=UPI00109F2D63|nr:uncharacterized protein LOC110099280 [Dendrobium catenatum]
MHYHINGTSPKEYKIMNYDDDASLLVNSHINENSRAEIVISLYEVDEDQSNSQIMGTENFEQIIDGSISQNDGALRFKKSSVTDITVGTFFNDATSFKNALRSFAIRENFGVRIKASDKKRVIATCSFQVRRVDGEHTCPGINRAGNRLASSRWVSNQIQEMVKRYPDIPPKEINSGLEKEFGLSLPYMKLWRAREQARDTIFGSVDDNYKWVPTMAAELLDRNPVSYITYTFNATDNSFQRFYVSFKVYVDGFLYGCKPLISLDACHLKSKYLGVLLSANSVDGNNGLFTIAFAVVEAESKHSWSWFLKNMVETIGSNLSTLSFISDMEKGLGEAIKEIYPEAEHRICIRHLWKNIKKNFRCKDGQKMQGLVWAAANAYTNVDMNEKLSELHEIEPNFVLISHFFTLQVVKKSIHDRDRTKPAVDLIDLVRGKVMEQRAQRKMTSLTWQRELVPNVEEYIRDITTRKDHLVVRQASNFKAEVEGLHSRHIVDIERKHCTCGVWQLIGLPCIHAVAFIGNMFCRYRVAYDGAITALPGKEQWRVVVNCEQIGVPNTCRPRGRPRKRRLLNFLEQDKRTHRCGRCGLWGHHRSTCKNPLQNMNNEETMTMEVGRKRRDKLPSRRVADDVEQQEFNYSYLDGF